MWAMAKCNSKIVWGAKNSWMEYNGASFHRANVNNQPLQMELAVHDFARLRLVHRWTTRHQRQPQATKRLRTLISFGLGGSRVDSWPNVTGKWLLKCNADALRYSIYFWNPIPAIHSKFFFWFPDFKTRRFRHWRGSIHLLFYSFGRRLLTVQVVQVHGKALGLWMVRWLNPAGSWRFS